MTHLNIFKTDHNSPITSHGKHNRVVAFLPDHEGLYCRVDHLWDLGVPTHKEIIKVARLDQGIKGHWVFDYSETHDDGTCTDYYFKPKGEQNDDLYYY